MAFKTGKNNVVSQQKAKIAELEQRLEEEKMRPELQKFATAYLQNLGTILAFTPFDKWPEMAKLAFKYAEKDAPTLGRLFKEKLPKE